MPLDPSRIRAVAFDYGNTLIPFREEDLTAYGEMLLAAIEGHFGKADRDRFFEHRVRTRYRPFEGDPPHYRENDLSAITVELVEELYGVTPDKATLDDLLRARYEAFLAVVRPVDGVSALLEQLGQRYRLGFLSNYPDGPAIRESIHRLAIDRHFQSIVVSGDMGYCKPHPIVFAKLLEGLDRKAHEVVYVGDNWLADVQGAKRVGMQAVHMRRWATPETFEPQPGDHAPDATIEDLCELEALLLA